MKRWYEAFLDGYKPAMLGLKSSQQFEQLKHYPYINPFNSLHEGGCIFFQNDESKQLYLQQIEGVLEDTYAYHFIVGKTLGFPEKSVTWFATQTEIENQTGQRPKERELYDVGVHWAGFYFASHVGWVDQEVDWLWTTYSHCKAAGEPLFLWTMDDGYIEIPFGNWGRLADAQKYILQNRLGVSPTTL